MARGEVCVLGAGIGGLAAALALARRGFAVQVLEQAAALAEAGAGIQVSPNGARVLAALGVEAGAAMRSRGVRLIDGVTGREVLWLDFARAGGVSGGAHQMWHRADLLAALEAACRAAGVAIRTGVRVAGIVPGEEGVTVTLEGGGAEHVPLLVAADGLHSVARAAIHGPGDGPGAPTFTGHVAWRALVAGDGAHPAEARVHMAPGRHLVSYPLRGGDLVNLVGVETRAAWQEEGWQHPGEPAAMRAAFAGLDTEARALMERVEAARVWGLFRHEVAARWARGRAALLGDAAHPTLPFMAQGANMALEDAFVLARCLASDAPEPALARYAALRRPRCARIVATAARNGETYHMAGPLRPAILAAMRAGGRLAPGLALRRFAWIHDFDVTA